MEALSKEEKAAIASLRRLEKRWPKSLWLFSASGGLHVMKCGANGERRVLASKSGDDSEGGMDSSAIVATIDIPNDGGDW